MRMGQLASFNFGGSKLSLEVKDKDSWVLKVWSSYKDSKEPEEEVFTNLDAAIRTFEQTTRGIFFQSKLLTASSTVPVDLVFDAQSSSTINEITCDALVLPYNPSKSDYDIRITQPVTITTKDWSLLKRVDDGFNYMRIRLFDAGTFKVLFDNVLWDNIIPRKFTRSGYDIVELRSRGDGVVRGTYYLNVPNLENDTRYLQKVA